MRDMQKVKEAVQRAVQSQDAQQGDEDGAQRTVERQNKLAGLAAALHKTLHRCTRLSDNLGDAETLSALLKASAPYLQEVRSSVEALHGSTERFAVVIDLMASASQLLDTETYFVACASVTHHLQRSDERLGEVEALVAALPQRPKGCRSAALS